nr:hypothetical protein GCM10025699_04560 [Microbacterium flavescens]
MLRADAAGIESPDNFTPKDSRDATLPLAAAVLATAVVMLAGCATPSTQPEQTAAAAPAPDATPSTTPSSEVRVVGAAERPRRRSAVIARPRSQPPSSARPSGTR